MREYHVNTHPAFSDELKYKKTIIHQKRCIHQAHNDGGPIQICVQTVFVYPNVMGTLKWSWILSPETLELVSS